jgi:hypothetical protein
LFKYVKVARSNKFQVTKQDIQSRAKLVASQLVLDNFKASGGYIDRFMDRLNFTLRKPTHKSQQNNKAAEDS